MCKNLLASNFVEYVQIILDIVNGAKKGSTLLFRGHTDSSYELMPSITRKEGLIYLERNIIADAMGKNPNVFYEDKYSMNLLVRMQHFGLPTRLLDVSFNALVALYFSCNRELGKDGEVFVFYPNISSFAYIKKYYNRDITIISQMYKLQGFAHFKLEEYLEMIGLEYNKTHYIWENGVTKYINPQYYLTMLYESICIPNFVLPMELSERQKRQQGAFIIFPNKLIKKENKIEIEGHIDKLEKDDAVILAKITIPKEAKEEIMSNLETFGITKEFLFPDSIDTVCEAIKEKALKRLEH